LKNHILVDGRLLQTNKTWSQLKERQKAWIGELLRNEYMLLAQDAGRSLHKDEYGVIVSRVYEQIEKREIWIPFNEVRQYFSSKVARYRKSFQNTQKEMSKTSLNERLNIGVEPVPIKPSIQLF